MRASVTVTVQLPALRFVGDATEDVCVPLVHRKFWVGEPPDIFVTLPNPLESKKQANEFVPAILADSGVKGAKNTVFE